VALDTGFNRELPVHESNAFRFCYDLTDVNREAELAGGERRKFPVALARIYWFGKLRDVEILIATSERQRASLPDGPIGLLGTGLLSSHILTIDFAARRVLVSESDT
jgi:predicted aspartyl protease